MGGSPVLGQYFYSNNGQSLPQLSLSSFESVITYLWNIKFPFSRTLKAQAPHQRETTDPLIVIVTILIVDC